MSSRFGHSEVDQVRDATDLIALIGENLALRPKGREHVGLCPFHDDHKPSLTVVTHKANAFYKCHSCGATGNAFNFVMDYHKMTFPEALKYLAERAGIKLTQKRKDRRESDGPSNEQLYKANAFACSYFMNVLSHPKLGKVARKMIEDRKIPPKSVEDFQIGAAADSWEGLLEYARSKGATTSILAAAGLIKSRSEDRGYYDSFRNRVIFPICDELGRPIAFGGRQLDPDDEPKYLNSPESPVFYKSKMLYGLHLAKRSIIKSKQAIVVEGYTDVLACHQRGICNVVGTLGTALTRDHARILGRLCEQVVLIFDPDEAGMKAADRAVELFFAEPVDIKICVLPDKMDPDDLLQQDDGVDRLQQAISDAQDALPYKANRFRKQFSQTTGSATQYRLLEQFMNDLSSLGFGQMPGVRRRRTVADLSQLLGVSINDIEKAIPKRRQQYSNFESIQEPPVEIQTTGDFTEIISSPARKRAEREFIGALLLYPTDQLPGTDEDRAIDITKEYHSQSFYNPQLQQIVSCIYERLKDNAIIKIQILMDDLESAELRKIIGELYEVADQSSESNKQTPAEHLRAACEAMDALNDLENYKIEVAEYRQNNKSDDQNKLLIEAIESRKKQGSLPAAMPHGVRS